MSSQSKQPIPRRPYKDGIELSIVGFGGIVVCGMPQDDANTIVAEAVDRGVNYFDVAPSYFDGEAERKQGQALKPYRDQVFLACKTEKRDAAGAQAALDESLRRAHTDHFDLYQFHAITSREDIDQILAPGGAAEVFFKARQQGKARFLGASIHSVEAALEMMERFPLDSILFPFNYVCYTQGDFGPQVLERAKSKGIARLALKSLAHTPWAKGEERAYPKCWYKPNDQIEAVRNALRFTLSLDLTAALPPGDERLFRMALNLAAEFAPLSPSERQAVVSAAQGVEPIFRHPSVDWAR
jgi:aryl-alcohol dehydrogenase-like predicted oxidoreductase